MSNRTETIVNKLIGAGLIGLSTTFFIAMSVGEAIRQLGIIPGVGFGISGLWMVLRRERREPPAAAPATAELQQIREALAHLQIELDGTQTQVERLVEERVFLERLL